MRFIELIESEYNEDLRSEVITLLAAVSAEGISQVSTQNLLNDLESQGYAVDEETLLDLLGTIEIVSSATADEIEIATSDADMMVGQDADEVEADRVDNLATDQATKDLGNDVGESIERLRELSGLGLNEGAVTERYLALVQELKAAVENSGIPWEFPDNPKSNMIVAEMLYDYKITDVDEALDWYADFIGDFDYRTGGYGAVITITHNGYDYDVMSNAEGYNELGSYKDYEQAKHAAEEAKAELEDQGIEVKIEDGDDV